ncbi:hypothetical protein [Daejeonella sp.]|uniref:hypothetical protein n=1 Tax=Daejeonella sp. TaxID=2805397 RepID=UPI0030BA6783
MNRKSYTSSFKFLSYPRLESNIPDQIRSLYELKDGWDFGAGKGISSSVIENACFLFNHFQKNEFDYAITPTSEGGVKITSKIDKNFFDITVNPDLTLDITHEIGEGADYETAFERENVRMDEIESYLNELLIKSCFLLERYTSENITPLKKGLIAIHSETTVAGYPSLTWTASSGAIKTYART